MRETEPPRREGLGRPPLAIVGVIAVVAIAALAWSVLWYEGSRRADAMIGDWLAAEASEGRSYDCADRRVGGFPFRVEVTCSGVSADVADERGHLSLATGGLRAVAMVWNLEHVIVELDEPLRAEGATGGGAASAIVEARWRLWQGSLRAPGGRIARLDSVADGFVLRADPPPGAPFGSVDLTAERIEVHQRHDPADASAEIAMSARRLVLAVDGLPESDPTDLRLVGRLVDLPVPLPRSPADFLAAWRDNDGILEIVDLRAVQGETVLSVTGRLSPDAGGHPEGTLTLTIAGPDVGAPGTTAAFGGLAPVVATALGFAGRPAEIDGREALTGSFDLRDGRLFFGPLPIARLPRLF
jgi:hypothetical protein